MFPKSPGEGPLGFELDGHLDDLGSFWGQALPFDQFGTIRVRGVGILTC